MRNLRGSDIIRIARTRRGLSQAYVATEYNIGERTLRRWEHGKPEPSYTAVMDILELCGLSVEDCANDRCDNKDSDRRVA